MIASVLVFAGASRVAAEPPCSKADFEAVVDEVAGTLIALIPAPASLTGILFAVALFRVFDIAKPYPAKEAERLPGGWGVVIDDVVAGAFAGIIVYPLRLSGVLA